MRVATVCALAISMALAASAASAQNDPAKALAVAAATAAPVATQATCPGNPNPLGVARVVEIDTTGGPGFGFQHFRAYDFLREGEVVLTDLWFGMHERRLAAAENVPINDELRQRVRREFPPPAHLDFRMHVANK